MMSTAPASVHVLARTDNLSRDGVVVAELGCHPVPGDKVGPHQLPRRGEVVACRMYGDAHFGYLGSEVGRDST